MLLSQNRSTLDATRKGVVKTNVDRSQYELTGTQVSEDGLNSSTVHCGNYDVDKAYNYLKTSTSSSMGMRTKIPALQPQTVSPGPQKYTPEMIQSKSKPYMSQKERNLQELKFKAEACPGDYDTRKREIKQMKIGAKIQNESILPQPGPGDYCDKTEFQKFDQKIYHQKHTQYFAKLKSDTEFKYSPTMQQSNMDQSFPKEQQKYLDNDQPGPAQYNIQDFKKTTPKGGVMGIRYSKGQHF